MFNNEHTCKRQIGLLSSASDLLWAMVIFVFHKRLCRPQLYFLPLSKVVPQFFIKGISSNTPLFQKFITYKGVKLHPLWFSLPLLAGLPALGCASCSQTSNQTGKLNQIGCKIIRKREKTWAGRERGSHNVPQYIAALQRLK